MEKLCSMRKSARRLFTRSANKLAECLEKKEVDEEEEHVLFELVQQNHNNLLEIDHQILEKWFEEDNKDDEKFEKDVDETEEYEMRWIRLKHQYNKLQDEGAIAQTTIKGTPIHTSPSPRIRLPQLDIPKFDGSIKSWLRFWGQFRKIDSDTAIDTDDKFTFLLQAMEIGSSARQLVDTFPPSGINYTKALEQLKQRFARDEIIIEYYIRDLLELIMRQVRGGLGKCSLRNLYDSLMTQIQGLESLGVTQDKYTAFLYPMVESALPEDVLKAYARSRAQVDENSSQLSKLLSFLRVEVEAEERIAISRSGFDRGNNNEPEMPSAACFMVSGKDSQHKPSTNRDNKGEFKASVCVWCEMVSHASSECFKAQKMTLDERKEMLRKKRACYCCLKVGHSANRCRTNPKCLICSRRHVTLMCNNNVEAGKSTPSLSSTAEVTTLSMQPHGTVPQRASTVLLQTIVVNVIHNNRITPVRAMIDTGAQRSFIGKAVIDKLNVTPIGSEVLQHSLFGGVLTKMETHRVFSVQVCNRENTYGQTIEVLEQKSICNYLPKLKHGSVEAELLQKRGILISDMSSDIKEIGMLLGSDVAGSLLTGQVVLIYKNLIAVETKLGWTLQGPITTESCNGVTATNIVKSFHCASFDISDMWRLETIGIRDAYEVNKDEVLHSEAWKFFESTVRMNEERRYEVKLPWLESTDGLHSNFDNALKRLQSITSKLNKLDIMKEYDEVFKEWRESSIIEEVREANPEEGYYLPHHAVVRESSLTTKIRPVFDASSSKKGEPSLNECLNTGVNLIELIPPLIVKFRKNEIGITADIKKAFLQISLFSEDRNFLKFLWWQDPNICEDVITYRHKRVVFGVTTSPFLLAATIRHHLSKYECETAELLRKAFYVDNCVLSVDNIENMNRFIAEAKDIMLEGNFDLRCWVTGPEMVDKSVECISVLGVIWNPCSDVLYCKVPSVLPVLVTKRSIMSLAHSIFDPVGFTCPATLVPKVLIQKCWHLKLAWDSELPEDLKRPALEWINKLHELNNCKVPRRLSEFSLAQSSNTLHVFCDASKVAYAGCVFLRSEFNCVISVRLVLAKCRVAPVKPTLTMPRLELLAALMATRLAAQAKVSLGLGSCKEYYWTDSSIVLAWLSKSGLCVYVHNRVQEILLKTNLEDWRHVPGVKNPADLPSRGCNAETLLMSQWWNGPDWLYLGTEEWPESSVVPNDEDVKKEIRLENLSVSSDKPFSDNLIFFKFSKTVRVVGWCLRWLGIIRGKARDFSTDLSVEEIKRSEITIFKLIQNEYFGNEESFKNLRLEVFREDNNLLRVKTRLIFRDDAKDFITPILLPSKHELVGRLVLDHHLHALHAGAQILTNRLRQRYWIVGVRRLVKSVIRKCVICRRHNEQACTVPQAPLPVDRTKCGNAFEVTGVDLAGPLILKTGEKCWVVLFTCATYRAVHLELCTSLSTEDFLLALRRFIARRGNVSTLWSDNGTNFCGANRLLEGIDWKHVSEKCSVRKINWKFIVSRAPWWGGFWERLIRALKVLLRRMLGKASVSRTELETLLCECESVLNSRPLTYLSQDSDGVQALTPAMFLHNNAPPSIHHTSAVEQVLNSRLKYVQKIKEDFKSRFRNEYLGLLVQEKQRVKFRGLKIGDVVLIQGDTKRIHWPLAIVKDLITGADGEERVARLKTARGELMRPLQRLIPLEVHSSLATDLPATRSGRVVRVPVRFQF